MFSTDELINKYEWYSDEDLYDLHQNIGNYSNEAKEALDVVLSQRGGLEELVSRIKEKRALFAELHRIRTAVKNLYNPGVDVSFLKKMIPSPILSQEETDKEIESAWQQIINEQEDLKVKPATIFGSIVGGIIGAGLGGVLWGAQLIYSGRIFWIFLAGLILISYGMVWMFTKKSKKNTAVIIATALSVILALVIGHTLYAIIGYKQ
jgi:hypothetical protein